MVRGFVFTFEAFVSLVFVLLLASFFSFSSFDSKKDFYRRQLVEDFAEVSVKSNAFKMIKDFDAEGLKRFYSTAAGLVEVSCFKFGFEEMVEGDGCSSKKTFFSASRSVFTNGEWRVYSIVLGFD